MTVKLYHELRYLWCDVMCVVSTRDTSRNEPQKTKNWYVINHNWIEAGSAYDFYSGQAIFKQCGTSKYKQLCCSPQKLNFQKSIFIK